MMKRARNCVRRENGNVEEQTRGSAIVRPNREGLLNDHYAMYFQQTLLSLVAITLR